MNDFILGQWLNSQVTDVPLNHLIWLNDYKTYGENSYVFQNKDILHELYEDYKLTINDLRCRVEAMKYAVEHEQVGKSLSEIYGGGFEQLRNYKTFDEINSCVDLFFAECTYLSDGSLKWLFDNGILDKSFYTVSNVQNLLQNSKKQVSALIKDEAVDAWYTGTYDEISAGVDAALKVFDIGGKFWAKCTNQTYMKAVYDHENNLGNIVTSQATVNRSNSPVKGTTISNAKALVGIRNSGSIYAKAEVTSKGNTITGSCISDNVGRSEKGGFDTNLNGFTAKSRIVYTFYPVDTAKAVAVYWADNISGTCTIYIVK